MDTWIQRLEHERKTLTDDLKAEEEVLNTSTRVIMEGKRSEDSTEVACGAGLLESVQQKHGGLVKRIEALMRAA